MQADAMEQLLASAERALGSRYLDFVSWLRDQNEIDDLARLIEMGMAGEAVIAIERAAARYASAVVQEYTVAAQRMADWVEDKTGMPITFDQSNVRAVEWAKANRHRIIQDLTREQREMIRNVISDGVARADNPRVIAQDIRASIGLTPGQERWIASYRRSLESQQYGNALGRELSSGQSDRTIRSAQAADRALTPEQIRTAVDRYRNNALAMRAETIARTEALRAVNQGAYEQIAQAVDDGDLPSESIVRTWVSTRDDRTRDSHRAMNRQERAYGEAFESGSGVQLAHPGDPTAPPEETIQCRCVITTRLVFGKILAFRKALGKHIPIRLTLAAAA